jgi:hypothetical protein
MDLHILQYDDSLINAMDDATYANYILNVSSYTTMPFKQKKDPMGWAVPFVTNHKYKLHWENGLDFTQM